MRAAVLLVVATVVASVSSKENPALKEVFYWKQLDFDYPDEVTRQAAIDSGEFIPENNLPLGVEVWKDKLFVTVPRWKAGIPASLNYINLTDESNHSPLLKPYPDWASHHIYNKTNVAKIVSTFRIRADECDRLWVLDTGLADILGKSDQVTPPKILIYDLHTDKILHTFEFDKKHIKDNSFFANIIVDIYPGKCNEAHAYIPDLGSYAIVVYSLKDNSSFRVQHHYFYMDPLQGNFNVGGVNFQWTDGIFSLALAPHDEDGHRTIYFHALASTQEFTVNSAVLQNATAAAEDYYAYKLLGSRGPNTQATASFLDPHTGVVFYTQINQNGVSCWNSFTHPNDYSPETNALLASDNETMLFPNDLKVDRDSNLWLLTDKLPTHIYRSLNFEEINYRIFKGSVKEMVKGTVCEVKEGKAKESVKESTSPVSVISTETSVEQSNSSSASTEKL